MNKIAGKREKWSYLALSTRNDSTAPSNGKQYNYFKHLEVRHHLYKLAEVQSATIIDVEASKHALELFLVESQAVFGQDALDFVHFNFTAAVDVVAIENHAHHHGRRVGRVLNLGTSVRMLNARLVILSGNAHRQRQVVVNGPFPAERVASKAEAGHHSQHVEKAELSVESGQACTSERSSPLYGT